MTTPTRIAVRADRLFDGETTFAEPLVLVDGGRSATCAPGRHPTASS